MRCLICVMAFLGLPLTHPCSRMLKQQALFHRNLAAVQAVLAGRGTRGVAAGVWDGTVYPLSPGTSCKELGQIACVPYATYRRERVLRREFQQLDSQALHPSPAAQRHGGV